ncbi:MAG: translocation/assembly module TamB domain-containing protein [Fimbriimonadales bacterium]|nr:translocation/assembly module TamB domain-containing protein [Fimbriimonadales bacterium]
MAQWRVRSGLWRAGQGLLVLLPAALIGATGTMYLWQVKLAVEESLPPALREYTRRQAELDIQIERVALRWDSILLFNPEVRTLSGARLFRARALVARLPANGAPVTLEIDRPEVWLQRDRQGVWNIEPLLRRPRPPEPIPLTLRVRARDGTLYFDDFLPETPVRATLWLDEFVANQPRTVQHITARGFGDALGTVQAQAVSDGQRWLVEARASRVQGARLKPYLPKTEFDVRRAWAQVALQIVYEPDQPLRVHGVAQGIAQDATFRRKLLPWREARFLLAFTESGLAGEVRSRDGGLQVQGTVDWAGQEVAVAAQAQVQGDAATLWRLLHSDTPLVGGKYAAQWRVEGTPKNLQIAGTAYLERLRTPQGDLCHLRTPILFTQGQLLLLALHAEYAGHPVRGKLWLDTRPKTPKLRLLATTRGLPLERIPALREQALRGDVEIALLAYGDVDNPKVEANLLTNALLYNQRRLGGGRARLQYADGKLTIPLAVLQGAAGFVQVSGEILHIQSENPYLDLTLDASELDLNLLAELLGYAEGELPRDSAGEPLRLDGIGYLTAQVRGSWQSPEAVAEAVVFDGRLGDLGAEITVANLNLLGREVRISQLQVLRRAAQLLASGVVQLPESSDMPPRFQVQGEVYEFDLATIPDWLRRELPIAGLTSGVFTAEGEPQQFTVRATLTSEGIQYDKTLLRENQVEAIVQVRESAVQVDVPRLAARVGNGTLTASGQWSSEAGLRADWELRNVALSVLAPYLPAEYRLTGSASLTGTASGTLDAPTVHVALEGTQMALNGVPLGDTEGVFEVRSTSADYHSSAPRAADLLLAAQLVLRTPDGIVRLPEFEYDLAANRVKLQMESEPLPIDWLRRIANALPELVPPAVAERLETLQGRVQAQLSVEGALDAPSARLSLNADTLEWRGQSLGKMSLQATWQGESDIDDLGEVSPVERAAESLRRLRTQRAELQQLRWRAETAQLEAKGVYTPDKFVADVEAAQLPLRWARLWEPSLPEFDGSLDLSLIAGGDPESPELNLSATVNNLNYGGYTVDQVMFSQIEVREGVAQTDDALIRMGGYQARLSGRLPFRWSPLGVPDDAPIQIQARLREQPLALLSQFLPIDPTRTQGTIEAALDIGGTLDAPEPRGQLRVSGDALALKDLRTALQQIGLLVEFDGREARLLQAQARSSEGGTLRAEGRIDLSGKKPLAEVRLFADSFKASEPKLPLLEGSAQAVVSGAVQITGALDAPQVQGTLRVQRGFLYLPPEFAPRETGEPLPINPQFEVRVAIADDFTLRNPNLDARMEGMLQVGGSLQAPTLAGEFNLRSGALNLPTARLRIEPDSVARLNYPFTNPRGETIARIELDVRASTRVVAPDFTGDPTRYRVEVDVRGPLDDPERLQLTARSDPPGLSEQSILSLLGRGQALAAIARGADPAQVFREQISDILTTQVLPGLLAPLETGIAEALDLELFSVDYTGLRPASLYLVKNLFDGVGIAYRRGIGVAGNEYQARLFYRLPFRNRLLQRLRFGFGFDHKQNRFLFVEGSLLFR